MNTSQKGDGGSPFYEIIAQKIFRFTNDGFPKDYKYILWRYSNNMKRNRDWQVFTPQ